MATNQDSQNPLKPQDEPNDTKSGGILKKVFVTALIILLVIVLGWFFLAPILGVTVAITAGAWGLLVASVIAFCIGTILIFLIPGIIVLLICLVAFVWLIIAVILFPIFFPILLPLFIILLVIALAGKKGKTKP